MSEIEFIKKFIDFITIRYESFFVFWCWMWIMCSIMIVFTFCCLITATVKYILYTSNRWWYFNIVKTNYRIHLFNSFELNQVNFYTSFVVVIITMVYSIQIYTKQLQINVHLNKKTNKQNEWKELKEKNKNRKNQIINYQNDLTM